MNNEKRKALEDLTMMDEKIDFSVIPEIREIPSDRVIGKFCRPRKTAEAGADEGVRLTEPTIL